MKVLSGTQGSGAGIIVGYFTSPSEEGDSYYLLKVSGDSYLLQSVKNYSVEQLLSTQPINNKSDKINLRIKCLDSLIYIYNGNNLINSWKSVEKIFGKVGIYADKNVLVRFDNILISGNK